VTSESQPEPTELEEEQPAERLEEEDDMRGTPDYDDGQAGADDE
jgi:hypothetical protein